MHYLTSEIEISTSHLDSAAQKKTPEDNKLQKFRMQEIIYAWEN